MATTTETNYDEQLRETLGDDSTATFETVGNFAGSNPTENAGSESLYAASGLNAARKTAGVDDVEDEDEEDEDEDDDEEDDDLEDDDDLDDDEDEEDEDDEDLDDDDDDDEDEDEDEDDDATLKMEPSDSIRGRATDSARAAARKRP